MPFYIHTTGQAPGQFRTIDAPDASVAISKLGCELSQLERVITRKIGEETETRIGWVQVFGTKDLDFVRREDARAQAP